uniref:Uncharacterized protein n=1 Tax=Escherichia coli TaxID=562 RepID=A0A7L8K8W6_ECOLX|nr:MULTISPECIES: hypothetical protein [Enterobacteriaceae]QOE89373.1 hypothetical protein TP123_59 [Escherichia coli]WHQ35345.1 hypothetical protein ISD14_01115 [Escherichia coli]
MKSTRINGGKVTFGMSSLPCPLLNIWLDECHKNGKGADDAPLPYLAC